jgi:outer membrane lipoprotein LolB
LQALAQFEFSGRVASIVGEQSVSAALNWQQQHSDSALQLRAPFGLGSLDIEYRNGLLRIQSGDGRQVEAEAAERMLQELLGFAPPLGSFHYWLLGCSDPASAADERLDGSQRLQQLQQDGWQISYQSYQQVASQWLPQRLSIERDGRKLKVVIQHWRLT